jgi:rhodanese-related sulfurtransferase
MDSHVVLVAEGGDMSTKIDRDEVQRMVKAGAKLVDVRPTQEYEEEHLAGAISLPLKTLDATTAARALERDRPMIVY